jgi:hypothetical protein
MKTFKNGTRVVLADTEFNKDIVVSFPTFPRIGAYGTVIEQESKRSQSGDVWVRVNFDAHKPNPNWWIAVEDLKEMGELNE